MPPIKRRKLSQVDEPSCSKNEALCESTFTEDHPHHQTCKISQLGRLSKRKRVSYIGSNYSYKTFEEHAVRTSKHTSSAATQTLKEYNKITISKSTFRYNSDQIARLQSKLAKIKS